MQGIPAVVVGFYAAKPMDFLVGAKGITSARDLKGKTVGISAPGSVTHLLTLKVLQGIGLDPATDVNIRPVGGEDVRFQALESGIIQAALLGSQGVIQGEKAGLKVIVASADVIDSLALWRARHFSEKSEGESRSSEENVARGAQGIALRVGKQERDRGCYRKLAQAR
jgi:ABC-type nitrate/sulfonate/bicarbonate transport system substrate-binding protein